MILYPPKPVVSYLIPTKKSAHDHLDQKFFFVHESYTIFSYVTKFGNFRRGFSKVGLSRAKVCVRLYFKIEPDLRLGSHIFVDFGYINRTS
jgi:hypothetical protein